MRFGTVGRPLPGTEVAIAADGEILIRGPHVFKGYFKDPAATEEALTTDGWLHSGDLGAGRRDGFVSITGRKKDLIITSSGKNVTPVNIESALRDSRYITEAVVYGDNRPYLVAMLTLDQRRGRQARATGSGSTPTRPRSPATRRVTREIQKQVDAVNSKLARIEQIKRFAILDHDLSQAEGELTPTLKVKRAFVYEKYADVFAGLYETTEVSHELALLQRRCGLAAHGPAHQPDGDQFGDAVRPARRLGPGQGDHPASARRPLPAVQAAGGGEPAAAASTEVGGRPRLPARAPHAPPRASRARRHRRAAGAGRRPDDDAAGPQQAAVAHVHGRWATGKARR